MTEIDPKLSFLKPGKAATPSEPAPDRPRGETSTASAEPAVAVDDRLDLRPSRTSSGPQIPRLTLRPQTLLRAAVMAAAFAAGAVQVATVLADAPPPARGDAALAASRTAPSQVVRVSAEARQAVSGGPVSWRAFFDHYDLPDSVREASMRRALGNLSPADLDAAADAPIPADRDIEIVLRN